MDTALAVGIGSWLDARARSCAWPTELARHDLINTEYGVSERAFPSVSWRTNYKEKEEQPRTYYLIKSRF